jgi:hypothetical protein
VQITESQPPSKKAKNARLTHFGEDFNDWVWNRLLDRKKVDGKLTDGVEERLRLAWHNRTQSCMQKPRRLNLTSMIHDLLTLSLDSSSSIEKGLERLLIVFA